ncbi:MAG: arachidonate 15-lipoxygenase [Alphaproteobacteria bacterium]|nr:arachidonate 15-lipoxygenase [Alphaproteobacteria bacterium]
MPPRPLLPQHDPDRQGRRRALEDARDRWVPDPSKLVGLSMAARVPTIDQPSARWLLTVGRIIGRIGMNFAENVDAWRHRGGPDTFSGDDEVEAIVARHRALLDAVDAFEEDLADGPDSLGLFDDQLAVLTDKVLARGRALFSTERKLDPWELPGVPNGRPASLDDYPALYRTLPVPGSVRLAAEDAAFARARLAGPNPRQLRRITALPEGFPVTEAHFGGPPGDRLARALDEGRVFLCDYRPLKEIRDNVDCVTGAQKLTYAPLALFAVPPGGGALRPVAIQLTPTPDPAFPIATPDQGWRWRMARTAVQVADMNAHEAVWHLGLTHLRLEPVALATHRQLAPTHPLSALLLPHFEGTFFINSEAVNYMLAPNGPVDRNFGGTLATTVAVAVEALKRRGWVEDMLPNDLAARGVDDREILPDYPYRDDGMAVWAAIHDWMRSVVNLYYARDVDVTEDAELRAWGEALRASVPQGGVHGFEPPDSREALVDHLTMTAFTASAQHAAVNFPQWTDMSFPMAFSGAGWAGPPGGGVQSEAAWTDMLPPLEIAQLQVEFLYLLGSVYHTKLGDYTDNRWPYAPILTDPAVSGPLAAFRARLASVERDIQAVNADSRRRAVPYPHLLPSRIPMSINI